MSVDRTKGVETRKGYNYDKRDEDGLGLDWGGGCLSTMYCVCDVARGEERGWEGRDIDVVMQSWTWGEDVRCEAMDTCLFWAGS